MEINSEDSGSVIRFGVFEIDVRAGELRKAGVRVKLQEQPYQVLLALLERAGRPVTREELRARLWPKDTFVDFDHSLSIAVTKIRDALDDRATTPRFIETLPRRGYRFVGPVERVAIGGDRVGARPTRAGQPILRSLMTFAGILVVATVAFTSWRRDHVPSPAHRIAVLPLKNLNPDASDYFSDGLTDEIIHNLSLIDRLEVKSRSSSFEFKDKPRNARDIGRRLGVDLVLEGSVLREGDRLRITAALVSTADDATVWSGLYDRKSQDVFAIQDEISRSIVNELRLKGLGGQRRYNANLEAYNLYLRAESLAQEDAPGNAQRLENAIDLFQQAIANEPDFAPAYAGIAAAYAHLGNRGRSPQTVPKMRDAAERALQLDPLLPEAYGTLGLVRAADLAWPDAEQAFRRALQLNPNLARVRRDYALSLLAPEGRLDEAQEQVRRAIDLDPLSFTPQLALAYVLLRAEKYEEARGITTRLLAASPGDAFAGQLQARALLLEGKPLAALAILEKQGPPSHGYLGYAYAIVGRRHEAEQLALEDDPAAARHQVLIYAALGDRSRVYEALQKVAAMDDTMANSYPGEPELAFLRDDPRMTAFRHTRGLP